MELGTVDWVVAVACVMWGFGLIAVGVLIYRSISGKDGKFD